MRGRVSQELVAIRQRLEGWRKHHGGRGLRIPEALWEEAVGVARAAGVDATARALRLNDERLRQRLARGAGKGRLVGSPESAFVELEMGPLGTGQAVVELVGRGGEQMRIHITGPSPVDLVGLSQAFWSRRS
jgi:hypothetical protein